MKISLKNNNGKRKFEKEYEITPGKPFSTTDIKYDDIYIIEEITSPQDKKKYRTEIIGESQPVNWKAKAYDNTRRSGRVRGDVLDGFKVPKVISKVNDFGNKKEVVEPLNVKITILNKDRYSKGGTGYHERKNRSVVIARHDIFPDSMTASVLAKAANAPILLTPSNRLDDRVADEIERLDADKAYIIGGESSIAPRVMKDIENITGYTERIGGADRYETSSLNAKKVVNLIGNKNKAVIVSGEVFPDALTVSPFASDKGYPILLAKKNQVPKVIDKTFKELKINDVYISGGPNTISAKLESKLPNLIKRLSGVDRYATSVEIAKEAYSKSKNIFVASGQVFPDALTVGYYAAMNKAPILLVKKDAISDALKAYIKDNKAMSFVVVGGKSTVSDKVAAYFGKN